MITTMYVGDFQITPTGTFRRHPQIRGIRFRVGVGVKRGVGVRVGVSCRSLVFRAVRAAATGFDVSWTAATTDKISSQLV